MSHKKDSYKHPQFQLRLPEDLKALIRESAEAECRSMTAEIIKTLKEKYKGKQK